MNMILLLEVCFTVVSSTAIVLENYTVNYSQMPNDNTDLQETKTRLLCQVFHHKSARLERYDPSLQLCCNGLHARNSSQQVCCKGVIIDRRKHICCGEEIFDAYGDIDCCGKFTFSASDGEICCDGELRKRPSNKTKCCGSEALDTDRQMCCKKVIHAKKNGIECCGSSVIDPAKDLCCFGGPKDVKLGCSVGSQRPSLDIHGGLDDIDYPSNGTNATLPHNTVNDGISYSMLAIIILMSVNVIGAVLFALHRGCLYRLESRTRIKGCINLRSYTGIKKYSVNSQSKNKTQPMNCLLGDTNTNIDVEAPTCRLYFLNNISDHFVDSETQTGVISQTNKKNVFGQPYTHRVLADESNATVNIPNSESRMTLPLSELRKHPIEVHCCSFDCIRLIRHKMDISDDVDLASPTFEYLLPGYAKLCDYAVVVLPFIGDPSQLRVWKFQSAEGQ